MLNAKALTELLSKNSDPRLCKRWYLMTPNGTLLAYTQPTDMRELRRHVAMAAMSWQDHQRANPEALSGGSLPAMKHQLHTLIIESEVSNVLVRRIQPGLLLVLEGGIPPRKPTFETRINAEGPDGELVHDRYAADPAIGTSISSKAESTVSQTPGGGVLGLHRKKLDAMATAIASDFEQTGFKMPDQSVNTFF
ncbi:hypothetical protein LTR08_002921 [Meristemomyces frigidus]|nr:hypothetical protein LTR08_002921 [Meristemomyces frigidus]